MAFLQNFGDPATNYRTSANISHKQMQNPSPHPPHNPDPGFDCNICLHTSHDPIVTLCGHLYCWPCIYTWLQVQNSSLEPDELPKCPICRSHISASTLIPLYGRGTSQPDTKRPNLLASSVPHRPPALGLNPILPAGNHPNRQNLRNPFQPHNRANRELQYFPDSFAGPSSTGFYSPTVNMAGELVFARVFGNPDTDQMAYPDSNYSRFWVNGRSRPRLRRQEMQLDKSLNRVSIFLFCCIILCLILF